MTEEKSINWLATIAPAILGIFGTCLGIGLGYIISTQADFSLSVQPIQLVAPIPIDVTANITVKDFHHSWHPYSNQIILVPDIANNDNISEITFDPPGFDPAISKNSTYVSRMKIEVGPDTKQGNYYIRIMGIGGDGKQKSCVVFLIAN